jgi:hypothetical protein
MAQTAPRASDRLAPPSAAVRPVGLIDANRLRYFVQHDSEVLWAVLHILLRLIQARLRPPSGYSRGKLGLVSFAQRFSAFNTPMSASTAAQLTGYSPVASTGKLTSPSLARQGQNNLPPGSRGWGARAAVDSSSLPHRSDLSSRSR